MLANDFCDIYGLQHVPFWHMRVFGYLPIIFIVCFVGILIIVLYRRYRKISLESSYDRALKVLTSKKIIECIGDGHGEEFYTMLMKSLRCCLCEYLDLRLESKTDVEMISLLMQVDFSAHWCCLFKEIVAGATMARFANQQIMQEQMKNDVQRALTMVTEMRMIKQQQQRIGISKK